MKRVFNAVPREDGGWKIIEQHIVEDISPSTGKNHVWPLTPGKPEIQRPRPVIYQMPPSDPSAPSD